MTLQTFLLPIPCTARPYEAGPGVVLGFHVRKGQKMAVIFNARADAQHKADELNRTIGANHFFDSNARPPLRQNPQPTQFGTSRSTTLHELVLPIRHPKGTSSPSQRKR